MGSYDDRDGATPRRRGAGSDDRAARLKAALRANLGKRRVQARALGPIPAATLASAAEEDGPCDSTM